MIRGLYNAASGMDVQQAKVDVISNNLANATTPGYKKESVQSKSFPEMLLVQQSGTEQKGSLPLPVLPKVVGTMGTGAMVGEIITRHDQGALQETGNSADIMFIGPGFLAVNAPAPGEPGRVCYTRKGALKVDREGYLTAGGYRVQGQNGPVQVGKSDFKVAPDGAVEVDNKTVDRLKLTEFNDLTSLRKEGEGLYVDARGEGRQAASTKVRQGFLEGSNVNLVEEMVDLMAVMRIYEASQRLIQAHDELLAKAVNQVGSLR